MQPLLIIVSVVVLALGVVFRPHQSSSPSTNLIPTVTVTQTPSPTPTSSPVPSLSLSPTSAPSDTWIYPGATEVSPGVYSSSISPAEVTNWYKEKIKALNLNIQTFVQTTANDRVLNKLSAANGNQNISIEISQASGNSATTIKIALDN